MNDVQFKNSIDLHIIMYNIMIWKSYLFIGFANFKCSKQVDLGCKISVPHVAWNIVKYTVVELVC